MEYRIKLCFVLLFALLSQHKLLAFNAENMLGKWGVTTKMVNKQNVSNTRKIIYNPVKVSRPN